MNKPPKQLPLYLSYNNKWWALKKRQTEKKIIINKNRGKKCVKMLGCLLTKHLPKDRNDSKLTNDKKSTKTQQKSSLDIHKNVFIFFLL